MRVWHSELTNRVEQRQEADEEVASQDVQWDHAATSQTVQRGLSRDDSATPHSMDTSSVPQACANKTPP